MPVLHQTHSRRPITGEAREPEPFVEALTIVLQTARASSASVLAALELRLEGRELGEGRIRVRLAIGRARTRRLLEALGSTPVIAARTARAAIALEIGTRATIALGPILSLRPVVATRPLEHAALRAFAPEGLRIARFAAVA